MTCAKCIHNKKAKRGQSTTDKPFTEQDWNDIAKLGYMNYNYGKTMSEKALYDWKDANPDGPSMASILFAVGTGPPQQVN